MPSTWMSLAAGIVALLCCTHARAQCKMDTECERDLICENDSCVAPSPATPVVTPATRTPAPPTAAPPEEPSPPPPRHSEVLKGVGIFVAALGGAAFLGAIGGAMSAGLSETASGAGCGFGNIGSAGSTCGNDYEKDNSNNTGGYVAGGLVSALVLTTVGGVLIAIGNRKKPARPRESARVSPWVGRQSGGLSLRLSL